MNLLDQVETTNRPKLPAQVWILSAVLALGLVAQYIGGEAAFSLLERGPIYSAAASALIEAMAMAEAFTLAMSYRAKTDDDKDVGKLAFNPFALGGLVISLGCSGIYNYVWVQETVPHLEPYQIAAYAVGPLAALASAGLTLGVELREHLIKCAALEDGQEQLAQDKASAEVARKAETERQARELQMRIEYEKAQAEIALEAERMRLESQEHTRATRARERDERARAKIKVEQDRSQGGTEPVTIPGIPVLERAKVLLEMEPDISGSELGRRLEVSPGWGRKLKRQVSANGKE